MNIKKSIIAGILFCIVLQLNGCVEPYEFEEVTYKEMLVIEAVITDEFSHQEINLSTTFPLPIQVPDPETGASVRIVDENQNVIVFEEQDPGQYVSRSEFAAQPGKEYTLEIVTSQGEAYSSRPQQLVEGSRIDNLNATRTKKGDGTDGVAIVLDSEGKSPFYRYAFKETFKIVSPFAILKDLKYITNDEGDIVLAQVAKTKKELICYRTEASDKIILSSSNALTENRLENFLIRFLETGDPRISYRYSILVKQYAIDSEAYAFYSTLKDLSVSESVFSQSQPGFIRGNIFSIDNPDEKVIGFFSVSSVASERIFFDYLDFYDQFYNRNPFATNCTKIRPSVIHLPRYVRDENYKFYEKSTPPPGNYLRKPSDYVFVPAGCVDCTVFGSNVPPEFWVDE